MAFHAEAPAAPRRAGELRARAAELDARARQRGARRRAQAAAERSARPAGRRRRELGRRGRRRGCASWRCRTPSRRRGRRHATTIPATTSQFLLAANPGSPLLPLDRVASGGELARAMLALRLVARPAATRRRARRWCSTRSTPASAAAAATAVGRALAALGDDHQVLVVTHLAQVAALRRAPRSSSTSASPAATRRSPAARRSTATSGSTRWPGCCRASDGAELGRASTPPRAARVTSQAIRRVRADRAG